MFDFIPPTWKIYALVAALGLSAGSAAFTTRAIVNNSWEASIARQKSAQDKRNEAAVNAANLALEKEIERADEAQKELDALILKHSKDTDCLLSPDDARGLR